MGEKDSEEGEGERDGREILCHFWGKKTKHDNVSCWKDIEKDVKGLEGCVPLGVR